MQCMQRYIITVNLAILFAWVRDKKLHFPRSKNNFCLPFKIPEKNGS